MEIKEHEKVTCKSLDKATMQKVYNVILEHQKRAIQQYKISNADNDEKFAFAYKLKAIHLGQLLDELGFKEDFNMMI